MIRSFIWGAAAIISARIGCSIYYLLKVVEHE